MKRSRKSAQGHYTLVQEPAIQDLTPEAIKIRDPRCWNLHSLWWVCLLMFWLQEPSLAERFRIARGVVAKAMPIGQRHPGHTYQGFIKALEKHGETLLQLACTHLRQIMPTLAGQGWTSLGIPAFAVDGSRVNCPRTTTNKAYFKRAGRKKTGPQMTLTVLRHLGTGLPWDFRVGRGTDSERNHLREMLDLLPSGCCVVGDAGFPGYEQIKELMDKGLHALIRVGSNVRLLRNLGGHVRTYEDGLVYLWPQKHQGDSAPLLLRLIVLNTGRKPVYLVTDLLTGEQLTDAQASRLYRQRWGVEVMFRSLKQTLAKRTVFSRAPERAMLELKFSMVGLWVAMAAGLSALDTPGPGGRGLSVAKVARALRDAIRRGASGSSRRLCADLRRAHQDHYVRKSWKTSHNWAHKKTERPPGAPKIVDATPKEIKKAAKFMTMTAA